MAARGMRNASNLPSRKGTEAEDGVLPYSKEKNSLSWKETYRAMAAETEDWSDFDVTVADGLE